MKKTLTFLALGALMATGYKSSAQMVEDFESTTGTALPTGWAQNVTPNDSTGWLTGINTALASTYFAPNAHTRFVCVNDDKYRFGPNNNSLLTSAAFDIPASMAHPYLSFDCAYRGGGTGGTPDTTEVATVEISMDGGTTWSVVSTLSGNVANWWEPRNIDLSGHTGAGIKLGFRYKDGGAWLFGFAVDNVKVFDAPATDIGLLAVAPLTGAASSYGVGGSTINLQGLVVNNGASTLSTYDVHYVFNGGTVVTGTISTPVAPFSTAVFTAPTPVTLPAAAGSYPVSMWVSAAGDVNASNDSAASNQLVTVAFMPVKRTMFEEPTGTWCGWCVRGIVYMDSLYKMHAGDVSISSVHNSDPMQAENALTTHYDTYMGSKISGYPSLVVDRNETADPSDAFSYYSAYNAHFGFANMYLTATVSGSNLNTAVTVQPALNLSGDYRVELIVTEDGVHGTSTTWQQHNYYTGGGSGAMQNAEYNFVTLPGTIPATTMSYDFVDRYTIPDMATSPNGVAGSLPATMVAGTSYNYTFAAVPVAATWNSAKLRVIALLIDNNATSPNFGTVLNSVSSVYTVGVNNVSAGVTAVSVFPNPANEEANVTFNLNQNSNVGVTVYDAVGRVVYTAANKMNAGDQMVTIPVTSLSTGVYNIIIATETGKVSQRFSVVK